MPARLVQVLGALRDIGVEIGVEGRDRMIVRHRGRVAKQRPVDQIPVDQVLDRSDEMRVARRQGVLPHDQIDEEARSGGHQPMARRLRNPAARPGVDGIDELDVA